MLEITSVSNQQIKDVVKLAQKKFRSQSGDFLLEGHKPIYEANEAGVDIKAVYTLEKNLPKFDFVKDKLIIVNETVLEKISTTDSVPEAVAVARQKAFTLSQVKKLKRLALLENIKDAGNLGTIIRSAAAFGIDAIILAGDSIDLYNPKVVRSAVGALFKIPVVKINSLKELALEFDGHNFIATVLNHKDIVSPDSINFQAPFVIMLGSEADGLSEEAIRLASIKTTIPISGKTESLNLSVAASVMFYIAR